MSHDVAQLFRDASELSESERADLAGLLIESLESERDAGVDEAWAAEIGRRVRELESGTVQGIPWERVRAELLLRLGEP
jgi:putative addiction module component (TIGR02574 family)